MTVIYGSNHTLTEKTMRVGLRFLSAVDCDLAWIYKKYGAPPLWAREAGFPTLVYIILEQQVSLASAKAAYRRLLTSVSPLSPQEFLQVDDAGLKRIGFSRQKTSYCRSLAEAVTNGQFDFDRLSGMDDRAARSELLKLRGVGPWTADIYLLMALRRPDILPGGDLALAKAIKMVKNLKKIPAPEEIQTISAAWKPWRAVAARLLWHYYLNGNK